MFARAYRAATARERSISPILQLPQGTRARKNDGCAAPRWPGRHFGNILPEPEVALGGERYNRIVPKAKDLELRLQRTEQQLRLFQKISRFMVRELSLQEVLQGVVSLVVEFTQCDSCLVYLLDGEDLVLCASNTPHPSTIGKVRMRSNEGLTGWVARERRLLAISREAYKDPRFKKFGELEEDTFEAFLSAPLIARNRVVGVMNVQHRVPHQHTGGEMEVLTTVGEQIGCVLVLARMAPTAVETANHVELVLSSGPISMKQ